MRDRGCGTEGVCFQPRLLGFFFVAIVLVSERFESPKHNTEPRLTEQRHAKKQRSRS